MGKAGLPTPRNSRINCPEDVVPAGEHVGFPAVIKPVSGACGFCVVCFGGLSHQSRSTPSSPPLFICVGCVWFARGVVRVNSMPELQAACTNPSQSIL